MATLVGEADAAEQPLGQLARSVAGGRAGAKLQRRGDVVAAACALPSTRTSWKVRATPSTAMRLAARRAIGRPRKRMLPVSGLSAPEIMLSTVVLPEPLADQADDLVRLDAERESVDGAGTPPGTT